MRLKINGMHTSKPIRRHSESEEGYILLAVICMLALLTIAMSVAIPEISKSIQRDREIETMHRGQQFIRAIQLYYRKFGKYPPSIDALVKTNDIRFLRKRYLDPMTRKDDWKPIYFGQNKTPLAMGFFGQPLGGVGGATPLAGVGPSGGNGMPGAGIAPPGGAFGSSIGGGMNSSPGGSSLFNSTGNSGNTGANINPTAGNGTPGNENGTGTATGATSGTATGSTGSGFMSGQSGQTFGGAGIVGFKPASPKQSILVYKKKDHYNQWEFTYSPMMDLKQQATAGNLIGVQPSTPTSPTGTGGSGPTSGPGFNNGPAGSSSPSFGGGSSTPTTQPQPQQ